MSFKHILSFIFALCLLAACKQNSPAVEKNIGFEVPKLLDRDSLLRNGTEWDQTQNFYAAQCATLRQNPKDDEAKLKLAECFIREARVTGEHPHYYPAALKMTAAVIQSVERLSATTPRDQDRLFRALSHHASVQLSLHKFADAKVTAERAIAINPHNAYIYGCLTDALVELGQYDKAVEMCDKMVSIRPDLRSYARVSYLREIHKDYKGAIEAMEMALQAGFPGTEETEWARLHLGGLHEKYGSLKAAEMQYRQCLTVRENYPFAMAALAGVEMKQGKTQDAEMHLKAACDIIPEVGFYRDLVTLYEKTGRRDAAQQLIPEIEKMYAEDMAAGHIIHLEMADFYLTQANNPAKALEHAQQEYTARPDNKDVNSTLAAIYEVMGDREKMQFHKRKS